MNSYIDIKHPVTVCKASAGTGKTYTLAAYYVGLLLSGEDYRSILAITFTNKATAEMSERILTYLYSLSQGGEANFLARARQFMIRDAELSDAQLRQQAGKCFHAMLADYDNVQIRTIDSFMQTLLSGLAGLLHQSAGQNTELDVKQVINRAVDELMNTAEGEIDAVMQRFIISRLAQESRWNVRQDLCDLAQELYNESVQILDGKHQIIFNSAAIDARRERLQQRWETNTYLPQIRELLQQLEAAPIDESYGKQPMKDLLALIRNTRDSLERPQKINKDYLFRGLTNTQLDKAREGRWGNVPADIIDIAIRLTEISRQCRRLYFTIYLSIELSHEMQLMTALQAVIIRQLNEANSALLSRTTSILSEALRQGDADFILEKAGIRYHHVLMDEFQDTSRLQWSVIRQLLMDILAGEGNTLLIVGDIKQSIYRWRNGDWHIMSELGDEMGQERLNERFKSLKKNFRSREEVVKFNLSLFRHIITHYTELIDKNDDEAVKPYSIVDEQKMVEEIYGEGYEEALLKQFYQEDEKPGGYVRFKAVANKDESGEKVDATDEILTDMFDQMEDLLAHGAQPSDMMVLVRKGSQAMLITEAHANLDMDIYPHLCGTSMVSAQSFLLEASEAVQLIISGLRMVAQKDEVAARHIEVSTKKPDLIVQIRNTVKINTPLYEAVSELVRLLLTDENGQYNERETAYINCMLDYTREYVHSSGSNIAQFLDYWTEVLHEKSIPVSSLGAIRIMTIHKSKGLQAQTLFVPFCNWKKDDSKHSQKLWCPIAEELEEGADYLPIYNVEQMRYTTYCETYEMEHQNARIDSINMLYVALTRAEDNLYIYTDYTPNKKGLTGNHVGYYLLDYTQTPDFSVGEPIVREEREAEQKGNKPFSFEHTQKTEAELWANSDQVQFVQSQEGAMYTDYGEQAYRRVARMDEGTLCHEIFAHIRKADELDSVLDEFESRGEIKSAEQRKSLRALISSAWEGNAQMRDWFTAPWQLKLEATIYIDRQEVRPDRVMINPVTNEAIVLDYKFGAREEHYKQQVGRYMDALRELGHSSVRGFLWYARENKLVEVK